MRLRDLQASFHGLVTAPEPVAQTLAARGQTARDLETMIVGDATLPAVARLDIYANMYFFRLLDVLRDDYGKLLAAVGDSAFHNLVTAYLAACPPAHPSIARAGARLPEFLAGHPLAQERPWLVPLAILERAYTELFDGPDAEPLTLDTMKALAPEQLMALTPCPIPCHRVLDHGFAIDPLWHALGEEGTSPEAAPVAETLLVWRPDVDVYHRALDEDERALFTLVDGATTIQGICERIPADSIDEAAQRLFNALGRWIQDGLLMRA